MSDNSKTKEAITCAIRHIGTGIYSSGKIRVYLMQKGYSEGDAISAVKHLIDTGYIDDKRASCKVLMARSGRKQESKQYIYNRLLEAGIDPYCADDVIDSLDSDRDTCLALYRSSFGEPSEDLFDRREEFVKLAQLRGYSLETALSALKIYLNGSNGQ